MIAPLRLHQATHPPLISLHHRDTECEMSHSLCKAAHLDDPSQLSGRGGADALPVLCPTIERNEI